MTGMSFQTRPRKAEFTPQEILSEEADGFDTDSIGRDKHRDS